MAERLENNIITRENENSEKAWLKKIDFGDKAFNERMAACVDNPENFIDSGGTSKVFDLGDQCIKLMINRHESAEAEMYDLGNEPAEEARIQNLLNDLEVEGAHAPRVACYYTGEESTAIVMERLDAVNLQRALNGQARLPKNFDFDDFYASLEKYVFAMHEQGVVHNDLEARNLMVDIASGKPRLIDFGRAKHYDIKPDNFGGFADKDLDRIEAVMSEVKKFLNKDNNN